ncbi:hypothetical protein ABCS02_22910 [Microbacterium sp. X-17]|uniref:hypothetical protein n=1 Tax=Microbacterium sp. X-17 TaxID=3144404 RepID=UPI0031F51FEB
MRKYLFGTGVIGAIIGGITLLRDLRSGAPFTWRTALAWLSWGIAVVLAVGAITDVYRASRGGSVDPDSPIAGKEQKLLKRHLAR